MTGRATAYAAISVVNALPVGIGAAIGIAWPARATAAVRPASAGSRSPSIEPPGSRTPVVRAAIRLATARYRAATTDRWHVTVRSTIPVARGLKSSSAVASAVVLATARAAGTQPGPEEVARLAAEVGRTTGASATGAFDDALAGLVPGGVVTDNRRDRPIRRLSVPPGLAAALWIPARRHPPSPSVVRRFRRDRVLARRAVDAALDGDWVGAMDANGRLVERAMGYRYDRLREAASQGGALASGVSGLGPTFAAVAPPATANAIVARWPRRGARRRIVPLFDSLPTEALA